MLRHLFLAAALCVSAPAFAQKTDLIVMEKMTSYEIRDTIAAGKTTVILPSGGTEQNGPGMAVGKHNFRVYANAQTIARRLGNALVASVIPWKRCEPAIIRLKNSYGLVRTSRFAVSPFTATTALLINCAAS